MAKLELKKVIKFNSLCPGCSDHTRYSRFHRCVDVVGIVYITLILSWETTERIPNLFTELVIIIHSYKAHNKLLILKEKNDQGA